MEKLKFIILRWWLRLTLLPRFSALYAFPFSIFLEFELKEIYKIGGVKAAWEAANGWVKKSQDAWKHAFAEISKKPVEEIKITDGYSLVKYKMEKPVKVIFENSFTAELRDIKFSTVALGVVKRFSNLIDGTPKVTVNGKRVGLGYWVRPGDVIEIKNAGKEARKK